MNDLILITEASLEGRSQSPCYLSVVVPLLNEADSLPELYARLKKVVGGLTDHYEIIFVDDGSTDNSFDVLEDLQKKETHIKLIQLRRNYGKATALKMGFNEAQGELIVTIDGDLQDQPEEIPKILAKLEDGNDLVTGWRVVRRDPLRKILASKVFNAVAGRLTGVRLHDMNCGLKGYRREVVESLGNQGAYHRYIPAIAHWKGFRVTEIAVDHQHRQYGTSKYGSERYLRSFFDLLTVMMLTRYLRRPLHLFGIIGMMLIMGGFGISIYLVIGWMMDKWWLGDRPLLLLGALLIGIGVQFAMFGLLAEMVTYESRDEEDVLIRKRL